MVTKYISVIFLFASTCSFSQESNTNCKVIGNELHCENCERINDLNTTNKISKLYLNSPKKCSIPYNSILNGAESITLSSNLISFDLQYDFKQLKTFKSYECFTNKLPHFIQKLGRIESLTFCSKKGNINNILKGKKITNSLEIHSSSISEIPSEVFNQVELKQLTILTLRESKILPTKNITLLKNLNNLYIPIELNSAWVMQLSEIKKLKVLHVKSVNLNDKTIKSLIALRNLEKLILDKNLKQEHLQIVKKSLGNNVVILYQNEESQYQNGIDSYK